MSTAVAQVTAAAGPSSNMKWGRRRNPAFDVLVCVFSEPGSPTVYSKSTIDFAIT